MLLFTSEPFGLYLIVSYTPEYPPTFDLIPVEKLNSNYFEHHISKNDVFISYNKNLITPQLKKYRKRIEKFLRISGEEIDFLFDFSDKLIDDFMRLYLLKEIVPQREIFTTGRSKSRIEPIQKYLDTANVIKYLDIGISEGSITETIIDYLDLKDSYGVDIISPKKLSDKYTFVQNTSTKIPIENLTFNLITMFMSAHHFTHRKEMFEEVDRLLSSGGLLIIREHDIRKDADKYFYNFIHAVYATILNPETDIWNFLRNYETSQYAFYESLEDWSKMFTEKGYQLIEIIRTYDNFDSGYIILRKL